PRAWTIIKKIKGQFEQINSKTSGDGLVSILKTAMTFLHIKPDCPHAKRLFELAMVFRSLKDFAEHLRQNRTSTIYDDRAEAVTLMTLHGAKGLEFQSVFITGLEEGLTPYLAFERTDIEEERRLFYVGMTRAMERLTLSCSAGRGGGQSARQHISRFIKEIPAKDLQIIHQKRKKKSKATQLSLF
ncbi:MAG: ATP-dependent helicase, partial [Desulfobulbaceae bacterium]|nr:ATP-dependent helicase [Desulfobulbaceae bacterium]